MSESKLWKNDNYLNPNIFYLFNKEIIEYDMKEAGFSLIQNYHLLDEEVIKKLKTYGKEKRKIEIGKLQRKYSNLSENLKIAFKKARKDFFIENELEDNDIISIKKDAIFVKKRCDKTKFGDYIWFRPKHEYTSYILLGKRLELYYSPSDFAVKGISDELLKYHEDYIIDFLKLYFHKMETSDNTTVIDFMRRFIDKYKRRELSLGYYRNFNIHSDFSVVGEDEIRYMDFWEAEKDRVDISYNYFNVLLKLIKIPL